MRGVPICLKCKNFISGDYKDPYTWKCKAFLDEIPYQHFISKYYENNSECNNGIGFEPIENNNQPSE